MNTENPLPPVESLTYEQARDQLVSIIKQMESGQLPLAETLEIWERGEALANHCQNFLEQAKQRMGQIVDGRQMASAQTNSLPTSTEDTSTPAEDLPF